jgi:Na+-driven multidrug efflux pump
MDLGVVSENCYETLSLYWLRKDSNSKLFQAIGTLVPHAHGAGNEVLAGRYLQLGTILFIIGSVPSLILWAFLTEEAVLWFGFDEEAARIGQSYAYPYLATLIFEGIDDCLHEFLDVMDHEKYSTVVQIIKYVAEAMSVVVMATTGQVDLALIGVVQAFIAFIMTVVNFAFVLYKGWLDDHWEGLALTFSLTVSINSSSLRGFMIIFTNNYSTMRRIVGQFTP